MKIRLMFVFIIFSILTGCRTMDTVMSSFEGRHMDDVMARIGAPDSQAARADGGMTYTYVSVSGNRNDIDECRQTFVTNPQKVVVSWSYRGCSYLVPRW